MRGIVWDGSALVVTDELEVRDPGLGEVQVRVLASGICHSDLNQMDDAGQLPEPIVLGHEAAGVVERLGPGVTRGHVGAPVAIASMRPCGVCRACVDARPVDCPDTFRTGGSPFTWRGEPARAYANVSSFAELITVHESQLVPTPGLEPTAAALIGCAVSTGYGVVRNVAGVREGDTVVVFGIGGVGVNVLQTARLQRAAQIVAVDVNATRAEIAEYFGADTFLVVPWDANSETLAARVRDSVRAPVDAAIECSGAPAAIDASLRVLGPGGRAALVGIPRDGTLVSFDVRRLLRGRHRVLGSLNGDVDPQRDMADIAQLAREGDLDLASQVTRVWPLADVEEAIDAVRAGEVVRAVLDHTR
ncbi:MAG TPA: zinc-binding dehydrogenase [Acidimicrobiales bacterium]|nr:zinc-binding dehydrogenase [Acidimicrobiales bacterium]